MLIIFIFFPEEEFMTHWVFWERQYTIFPGHSQSNCITGQQNPKAAGLLAALTLGYLKKSSLHEALGKDNQKRQQPEDPVGLRGQTTKVWSATSLAREEARGLLAHCMDKVGGSYAGVGETWGLEGRGDFIHFIMYYHAISLLSQEPRARCGEQQGPGSSPSTQLSEASMELMHPRSSISTLRKWHFTTEYGPSQTLAATKLLSAALPTPVTNKISTSFTSIKSVKQDRYLSHQMSNVWSKLRKKLVGIVV